jgi:hypothetical protein
MNTEKINVFGFSSIGTGMWWRGGVQVVIVRSQGFRWYYGVKDWACLGRKDVRIAYHSKGMSNVKWYMSATKISKFDENIETLNKKWAWKESSVNIFLYIFGLLIPQIMAEHLSQI